MKYTGKMDIECILLCDAINKLPRIQTTESCCGHGKEEFRVWFTVEELKYLPPLLYYFDGCHCDFYGWEVLVTTDCGMSPVTFSIRGPVAAYKEANQIASLIKGYKILHPPSNNGRNKLKAENKRYRAMLERIITIAPLAKTSYIISEAEKALKGGK